MANRGPSRYAQVFVHIFHNHYRNGDERVEFGREEIPQACDALGINVPKNLGDVIYKFRYRQDMPPEIARTAAEGNVWIVEGKGDAKYAFRQISDKPLVPNEHLAVIKIPDSTPGIISSFALSSEQALLAKVRYNRLIDIFTGIVCYSLQNHLRANVRGIGQMETDEVYLGVDRAGNQYVIPVEAKGGADRLSVVQMNQDLALAKDKFGDLECRLVGAQFVGDDVALFLFAEDGSTGSVNVIAEKRYRLVDPYDISAEELSTYRKNAQLDSFIS